MISFRSQIIGLIEQGAISEGNIEEALTVAKVMPTGKAWHSFIDRFLLWLGGMCLSVAVIFFIAYNWDVIGRFTKFGMIEGLIVVAITAYCMAGKSTVLSKVSLLAATIFLGVLLALYGQTYQTGADPWQLFFSWALLMLPWALIGRFPAIWIVWIVLINISIFLYFNMSGQAMFWQMVDPDKGFLWLAFCCNTLALIIWEVLSKYCVWLAESWAHRLLAFGSGVPITIMVVQNAFAFGYVSAFAWQVWAIWVVLMYIAYRKIKPDLFMLAGCCMSGIIVSISFFGRHVIDDLSAASFLFLAMLVIGMGAGTAFWLKHVHEELQS